MAGCAHLSVADRLDEITGIGERAAQVIIAEVGLDMIRIADPRAPGAVGGTGQPTDPQRYPLAMHILA